MGSTTCSWSQERWERIIDLSIFTFLSRCAESWNEWTFASYAALFHGLNIATRTPIVMIDPDAASRQVTVSFRRITASDAAMAGTSNCTMPACVDFNRGNTLYQIAYPIPEVTTP